MNGKALKGTLIYEEKTELLRRGLFDVQNEVGLGKDEEAYHQAYKMWLDSEGVPHRSKPPHNLELGGEMAHTLYPDFVAWDAITIELKAPVNRTPPAAIESMCGVGTSWQPWQPRSA
jgi:hypothetical protein